MEALPSLAGLKALTPRPTRCPSCAREQDPCVGSERASRGLHRSDVCQSLNVEPCVARHGHAQVQARTCIRTARGDLQHPPPSALFQAKARGHFHPRHSIARGHMTAVDAARGPARAGQTLSLHSQAFARGHCESS